MLTSLTVLKTCYPGTPTSHAIRSRPIGWRVFRLFTGGFPRLEIHGIRSDGTCEVVARVLSEHPSKTAAWIVLVSSKAAERGFLIKINVKGELFLEPSPWKNAAAFRQIDPRMGPITHPAIKPGNEFNKLLLIIRKREVVIFVNGVQVCDPVRFDYDLTPAGLQFGAAGPGMKRAEFDRLEIREMMQPEDTPAKAEATRRSVRRRSSRRVCRSPGRRCRTIRRSRSPTRSA